MSIKKDAGTGSLEERFSQLANELKDSPEKEAISILHAMLLENRRNLNRRAPVGAAAQKSNDGMSLDAVANLYKSAPGMDGKAENEGLAVGGMAPDFTLEDANAQAVRLSDFRGQPVVLAFYPLDWSPACSDQLSLYQSELSTFKQYQAQLLAISVDSLYSHGAWAAVRGLTFPLLSDFNPKGAVAKQYQVMRKSDGFTERALFVIDREGKIRYRFVSPELHKIPSIYDLLAQLDALESQPASAPSRK
jgi:peroxiredoxin